MLGHQFLDWLTSETDCTITLGIKTVAYLLEGRYRTFFCSPVAFGVSMREKGAVQKYKCHDSILSRQEHRGLKRCISYSSEVAGSPWVAVEATWPRRICGMCQYLQWTCWRDPDPGGRPGDREAARVRASTWLNQSRINLWSVSAVVCVTHSSSLLWSILICYWLNTLRYFMYLSASLHLRLIYTIHPKN